MNRQQRRKAERERAVEAKYCKNFEKEMQTLKDWQIEIFLTCFGVAVHNAYGFDMEKIAEGMREFNTQLVRFLYGDEAEDIRDELYEKTGIFLSLMTDGKIALRKE